MNAPLTTAAASAASVTRPQRQEDTWRGLLALLIYGVAIIPVLAVALLCVIAALLGSAWGWARAVLDRKREAHPPHAPL